jgi:hypothetical protein
MILHYQYRISSLFRSGNLQDMAICEHPGILGELREIQRERKIQ